MFWVDSSHHPNNCSSTADFEAFLVGSPHSLPHNCSSISDFEAFLAVFLPIPLGGGDRPHSRFLSEYILFCSSLFTAHSPSALLSSRRSSYPFIPPQVGLKGAAFGEPHANSAQELASRAELLASRAELLEDSSFPTDFKVRPLTSS